MGLMKLNIDEKIVQKIGEIAEKENYEVYAVGGFVRDKILKRPGKDIDFVVVGDAQSVTAIQVTLLQLQLAFLQLST